MGAVWELLVCIEAYVVGLHAWAQYGNYYKRDNINVPFSRIDMASPVPYRTHLSGSG